jgi:hypothetical protein
MPPSSLSAFTTLPMYLNSCGTAPPTTPPAISITVHTMGAVSERKKGSVLVFVMKHFTFAHEPLYPDNSEAYAAGIHKTHSVKLKFRCLHVFEALRAAASQESCCIMAMLYIRHSHSLEQRFASALTALMLCIIDYLFLLANAGLQAWTYCGGGSSKRSLAHNARQRSFTCCIFR